MHIYPRQVQTYLDEEHVGIRVCVFQAQRVCCVQLLEQLLCSLKVWWEERAYRWVRLLRGVQACVRLYARERKRVCERESAQANKSNYREKPTHTHKYYILYIYLYLYIHTHIPRML